MFCLWNGVQIPTVPFNKYVTLHAHRNLMCFSLDCENWKDPGVVAHVFNTSTKEAEASRSLCEFKTILIYIAGWNYRLLWPAQEDFLQDQSTLLPAEPFLLPPETVIFCRHTSSLLSSFFCPFPPSSLSPFFIILCSIILTLILFVNNIYNIF